VNLFKIKIPGTGTPILDSSNPGPNIWSKENWKNPLKLNSAFLQTVPSLNNP